MEPSLDQRSQLLRVASVILTDEMARQHHTLANPISLDDHINQVFEQISADELSKLQVEQMAHRFGCSRRHLNRLFQKHFGLSAGALRLEIRLLKALSLLGNTKEKVISVAQQCEFNHLGLFNTYFKRRFGCSPSQWRRNFRTSEKRCPFCAAGDAICRLRHSGLCPMDTRFQHLCPASLQPPSPGPVKLVIRVSYRVPGSSRRKNCANRTRRAKDMRPLTHWPQKVG